MHLCLLFHAWFGALALAATPVSIVSRRPAVDPILPGEQQELEVTYIGIPGLHVVFEVLPFTELDRRSVYHVRGTAWTTSLVGLFFRVEDQVESWIDFEGLFSHQLKLVQNQTDLNRVSTERHDWKSGQSIFENHVVKSGQKAEDFRGSFPVPRFAQDSLSAFYFLRTLPLNVGARFVVPVVSEGDTIQAQVTVTGTERVPLRFEQIPSYVIRLEKLDAAGKPLPSENLVWISIDERRILTRMDVKTRWGHVIASLKRYVRGTPSAQR